MLNEEAKPTEFRLSFEVDFNAEDIEGALSERQIISLIKDLEEGLSDEGTELLRRYFMSQNTGTAIMETDGELLSALVAEEMEPIHV